MVEGEMAQVAYLRYFAACRLATNHIFRYITLMFKAQQIICSRRARLYNVIFTRSPYHEAFNKWK
jgi:hypothetical protein